MAEIVNRDIGEYMDRQSRADMLGHTLSPKDQIEEVLDPALPIIDCHQHFRDRSEERYLFHDFLADVSCGHNIVATVAVECGDMYSLVMREDYRPIGEVEFLNGIAAMFASGQYGATRAAAGIVGFANLKLGERVRPILDAAVRAGGGRLKGVRNPILWHPSSKLMVGRAVSAGVTKDLMADHAFREGFSRLSEYNLTFDAWIYHTQLPDLVDLARCFPANILVLNHTGGPACTGPYEGRRDEVFAYWRSQIQELARCPNVYVKLGGLGMPVMGFGFAKRQPPASSIELANAWRPYFETCIEAFQPNRCMFESNFPPDRETCSYLALWNAYKRFAAGYSPTERTALFSGTAATVYRL